MTSMRRGPYGEIPGDEPVRAPSRRRKSLRHYFCEGIEAAVKAEPDAFAATKPRTMLGLMVHSLVRGAATGRCDQVKLVVFFLDEGERRRVAAEEITALDDNSQGISGEDSPPEPEWDWKEDGSWDASSREDDEAAREEEEKQRRATATEAKRDEIRNRVHRMWEADRLNAERRARLELEQEGRVPVSGKI